MSVSRAMCAAGDVETARRNRRRICEPRGYCGPFVNEEYFATFGDGSWCGTANCVHCGYTVDVAEELEKWEATLWRREFGVTAICLGAAVAGAVFP